jgi:hypothetical protein
LESVPSSTELNSNDMALNDQKQEAQGANKQEILEFLSGEDDLTEKNIDMICQHLSHRATTILAK